MKNNITLFSTAASCFGHAMRLGAALLGCMSVAAYAALSSVSPTNAAVQTSLSYTFTVTGAVGESVSNQSLFCLDLPGVTPPSNGIIFPAAGGCTPSSVTPFNPVAISGNTYRFSGTISSAQSDTMRAEAAAAGQPVGNRVVYWRQGFGTSGFAVVRINLVELSSASPTLLPSSINFPNVPVGQTSAPQTLTFSSNSSSTHPSLSISHPPWINATTTCPNSLTANLSCQITAACAPTSPGPLSSTISVTAGSLFVSSAVSCTGVTASPLTLTPSGANFGSVTVGTASPPQVFTLGNPNNTAVSLISSNVTPNFTYTSNCGGQLAGNSTCQFIVVFTPTLIQAYSGVLSIVAASETLSRGFTGIGAAAPVVPPSASPALSPATFNFGAVTVGGTPGTTVFTLTNPTTSALGPLTLNVAAGFTQTSNCGTTLAASSACQITVRFAPPAAQAYTGLLSVTGGSSNLSSSLSGIGTAIPVPPVVSGPSSLTDVSPKRAVGNVSSDLSQVLSYTFVGNSTTVTPGDGIFCLDLIGALPSGSTTTGNPCASGTEFARHPTINSAFQYTRVGAFVRAVRETIRVPSAVSRFARENNRARYYFVRNFLPNQYAVVAIELLGNVANQPIALTDMRMYFKQGGEQPIVFLKRGSALPPIEAKINFTGSGWLRGAWEIVQPGDVEPTENDLITDASLPLQQRGLQRRYTVVGSFQQYLAAVGQATLTPPDLSRFPVTVDGGYRVLLRIFADPAIGAEGDARLASGSAGFALPTARYFVGSFASRGARSTLPAMTINRPAPDYTFTAIETVSFGWQASRDAAVYLLEAVDAAGRVVAAAQVPASVVELNATYTAPQPWRSQAAKGATRWRVTAYGRDGELLARSDWRGVQF